MGLLDRAQGKREPGVHAEGGLLRKAESRRVPEPGSLGEPQRKAPPSFLARALDSTRQELPASTSSIPYPDFDLDEASGAIDAIPLSAEYPIRLFDLLKDMLAVSSGGLFFFDRSEGVYAPLALDGFDQTTSHRLRLPAALLGAACPDGPVLIPPAGLEPFRMFFSSQGFRRVAALRLIPLRFYADQEKDGRQVALILAAEPRDPGQREPVPPEWQQLSQFLGERLSMWAQRFGRSFLSLREGDPSKRLSSALEEAARRSLKTAFVVLPFERSLESMERSNPQADRFRLFSELRAFVGGMIGAPGLVLPLPRYRLGLLFASAAKPDVELLLHQMEAPLHRVFPSMGEARCEVEAFLDPLADPRALERWVGPLPAKS